VDSKQTQPAHSAWLQRILFAQLAWRFTAFVWFPLSLQTWPGAVVEASAIASTGCVVAWLAMGDGPLRQRVVQAGLLYIALRLLQDLGVLLHAYRLHQTWEVYELEILRRVEDQTLACSVVLFIAIRSLTGWRIVRHSPANQISAVRLQFQLLHLFLLTGLVALLFGVARADWFEEFSQGDTGVLFLHAITIALAIVPALVILLQRPRAGAILLLLLIWGLEPIAIAGYFHFAEWFPFEWEVVRHLITTVAGPAAAATTFAFALRWSGYRLCSVPARTKRQLPDRIDVTA